MRFVLVNSNYRAFKMLKQNSVLYMIILFLLVFSGFAVCAVSDAQEVHKDAADYNKTGLSHFNKGYFKLTTKNKKEEASQSFILAIREFKKAIALDKQNMQAHRNLARVYYVQKRYLDAAEQYKKVTDLNPLDIDTHIIISLAYSKTHQYDAAIKQLAIAKTFTADEAVIQMLDRFIGKLEQEQGLR